MHFGVDARSLQLTADPIGEREVTSELGRHPLLELVRRSCVRCRLLQCKSCSFVPFKLGPVGLAAVATAARAWTMHFGFDARILQLITDAVGERVIVVALGCYPLVELVYNPWARSHLLNEETSRFVPFSCKPCQQSRTAGNAILACGVTRTLAVRALEITLRLSCLAGGVAVTTTSKTTSYECDGLRRHVA